MLRPLTDDEASRVVSLGTFEIDLVRTPTGAFQQRREVVVFPLDARSSEGYRVLLTEAEESLFREYAFLSRDEIGLFGVSVGPGGRMVRTARPD